MTILASKCKEFSHVYIPGLVNDIIPSFQSLEKENKIAIEEERRNLYVAITRTKATLTLTYAKKYCEYSMEPPLFLEQMGI